MSQLRGSGIWAILLHVALAGVVISSWWPGSVEGSQTAPLICRTPEGGGGSAGASSPPGRVRASCMLPSAGWWEVSQAARALRGSIPEAERTSRKRAQGHFYPQSIGHSSQRFHPDSRMGATDPPGNGGVPEVLWPSSYHER